MAMYILPSGIPKIPYNAKSKLDVMTFNHFDRFDPNFCCVLQQNESSNGLPPRLSVMRPDELRKCIGWDLVQPPQPQVIVPTTSTPDDSSETEGIVIKKEEDNIAEESAKTSADGTTEPEAMETDEPDNHIKSEFKDMKTEECFGKVHPLVQLKNLLEKYMHSNEGEEQQGNFFACSWLKMYDRDPASHSIFPSVDKFQVH